jgi:release factor glutamine methyltransferase
VSKYEPPLALDGGKDGLCFYKRIIKDIDSYLKPGGFLAVETGYDQAQRVAGLMEGKFKEVSITKDYSGIQRVVTGTDCS